VYIAFMMCRAVIYAHVINITMVMFMHDLLPMPLKLLNVGGGDFV